MKTVSLVHPERSAGSVASEMAFPDCKHQSHTRIWTIVALLLLGLLAACSDDKPAEPTKPEVKGPELVTARTALQKVYVAARGWSQDARPYRLESSLTSDGNGHDGKSAVWRGSFASATKRTEKSTHGREARPMARLHAALIPALRTRTALRTRPRRSSISPSSRKIPTRRSLPLRNMAVTKSWRKLPTRLWFSFATGTTTPMS